MQGNDRKGVERRGAADERAARRHDRGLLAIGAFKLVEAVFFQMCIRDRDLAGSSRRTRSDPLFR